MLPQLNLAIWAIRGTFDPEVIVFGGEIPEALAQVFIERVSLYTDVEPRYGIHMPPPKLVYTEVPNADTALGAAITPLKAQFFLVGTRDCGLALLPKTLIEDASS